MRTRSVIKHAAEAVLEASLIAILVVGLMAATAFAGKPSAGGTSGGGGHTKPGATAGSIAIVMVTDANGNGAPNWNDRITYDVSKVGVTNPFVTTKCMQNGVNVFTIFAGYYPGYMWPGAQTFNLSETGWMSGAATCTVTVDNSSVKLVFDVAA